VFDYGCGHGDDLLNLRKLGIECEGWDPAHRPRTERMPAEVVNLGYVINVIEEPAERVSVLREAWTLTQKLLIVSARLLAQFRDEGGVRYRDGWLSRSGTFQKYYEQHELRDWIDGALDVSSIPAGPGVFYVFRDENLKQSFIASRYRRKTTAPRLRRSELVYEQHKPLLEPLAQFVASRGRLPEEDELAVAPMIRSELRGIRNAFNIIRRVTGAEQWERIREERSQDLLVYLALARFGKRPNFSQLPRDLQFDVRAFFSTYKQACAKADELLFSAGNRRSIEEAVQKAQIGKATPTAIYIHVSALAHLPFILRVYEGCARAYIGAVEGANIIKLYRDEPKVSYLSYPEFESDPHPSLAASLMVDLQTFRVKYREYHDSPNPPILHRKETFLAPDHPMREKFARLTCQEEDQDLYAQPESIGTKEGWRKILDERGLCFSGHRLLRKKMKYLPFSHSPSDS